jgi:hypothetical protein
VRITYRTLRDLIDIMDEDQLDSDVTVEIGKEETECFPAELRICCSHDSLDDGHPVLFVRQDDNPGVLQDDIEEIAHSIGLIK